MSAAPQPAITVDFNQNAVRRGSIPTPDGALPIRRKTRRGMVSLQEWDAKVASDNKARGTTSETKSPELADLIEAKKPKAIAYPPAPGQPDLPPSPKPEAAKPVPVSKGAIMEDSQIEQDAPAVNLPQADPQAVAAMKAEIAAAIEGTDFSIIPPPPAGKAAKPPKPTKAPK